MQEFVINGGRQSYFTHKTNKGTAQNGSAQKNENQNKKSNLHPNELGEKNQSLTLLSVNETLQEKQMEQSSLTIFSVNEATQGQRQIQASLGESDMQNYSRFTMGDTVKSEVSQPTPKELLKMRKEREILQRQKELSRAAQEQSKINHSQAELLKIKHTHGTMSKFYQEEKEEKRKFESQTSQGFNRVQEPEVKRATVTQQRFLQIDEPELLQTESTFVPIKTPVSEITKLNLFKQEIENPPKELVSSQLMMLKSKQQKTLETTQHILQQEQQVYSDEEGDQPTLDYPQDFEDEEYQDDFEQYDDEDFEDYEEESKVEEALTLKQTKELYDVVEVYRNELAHTNSQNELEEIDEDFEDSVLSLKESQKENQQKRIINNLRETLIKQLGQHKFSKVYEYMTKERQQQFDDKKMQNELLKLVGKSQMSACFNMDQLIYWEYLLSNKS